MVKIYNKTEFKKEEIHTRVEINAIEHNKENQESIL